MESELKRTMAVQLREWLAQSARLANQVSETIKGDNLDGRLDEVAAALEMIERGSFAARVFLETRGVIVFGDKGDGDEDRQKELAPDQDDTILKPTTFAHLLRQRIEGYLPEGKDQFIRTEVISLVADNPRARVGAEQLWQELGIEDPAKRSEAADFAYRFLTTPAANMNQRETHTFSDLRLSFQLYGGILEDWSKEIGYDWSVHPTVNRETMLQIRGLTQLNRLLERKANSASVV